MAYSNTPEMVDGNIGPYIFMNTSIIKTYKEWRINQAADVTTNSWYTLASGTFTKKYSNTKLIVFMGGSFYTSKFTSGFSFFVNGSETYSLRTNVQTKGQSNNTVFILDNLAAGNLTLEWKLWAQDSTTTAYIPGYNPAYCTIIEV